MRADVRYYSFNRYLRDRFNGKVRKLGLNAGFPCPNRSDKGGCVFCNEKAFSDYAGTQKDLHRQIRESMALIRRGRNTDKFIAYFQNSTSTNAPVEKLKKSFDVIKEYPDIVALSVSTRPDCIDEGKLDLLQSYTGEKEVWVEYGLQTAKNESLDWLGRGHTFEQTKEAIIRTSERNINVAVHVILGIPEESIEEMVRTARIISDLPVKGVKLHVLHVLKDTALEKRYKDGGIQLMSQDEYVRAACLFMENLSPECVMLRLISDARKEHHVAPSWMNDKFSTINLIEKEFEKRKSGQGSVFSAAAGKGEPWTIKK